MTTLSALTRETVLVVDDSPDTLGLLTDSLEALGLTVLVALDGETTMTLLERVTPDVILMDALMPGMDGFETTRRIKLRRELAHIPVIFMTGLSETRHIVEGFKAGGVDYLTKPIVPDEVIVRMRVHLANARQTHSAHEALDDARRFLLSVDRDGRILWGTPQAARLVEGGPPELSADGATLAVALRIWLRRCIDGGPRESREWSIATGEDAKLVVTYFGEVGRDEFLLRLVEHSLAGDRARLQERFGVTPREAEVLFWIARGKSNREIALILDLSPRTVNKHLELVFQKLAVDNRTSAATLALQALGG
ncbi:MAG: response regulator [Thiohalocapsa sp.]|jgi:DNA-binding NarL/FixJ family response regulator|nr:response regulator [Thiohalocapsa sp.]MCF7990759.1 response regulator [Thiohalocapsa sp.]